jgi:shikimate kinase
MRITNTASPAKITFAILFLCFPRPSLTVRCRDMLGCAHDQAVDSLSTRPGGFNDGAAGLAGHSVMSAPHFHVPRTIVLVGLMGAGKTNIGRRLAQRLGLPFVDADSEIESAAGETIEEIFERRGEAVFREGERKVIARLLGNPVHVLATGGGAFMDGETRALIRQRGISVWLRADLELLYQRVSRRNNRPLLKQGNPRETLARLIEQRYPVYAQADITVETIDGPPEATMERVMTALERHLSEHALSSAEEPLR